MSKYPYFKKNKPSFLTKEGELMIVDPMAKENFQAYVEELLPEAKRLYTSINGHSKEEATCPKDDSRCSIHSCQNCDHFGAVYVSHDKKGRTYEIACTYPNVLTHLPEQAKEFSQYRFAIETIDDLVALERQNEGFPADKEV